MCVFVCVLLADLEEKQMKPHLQVLAHTHPRTLLQSQIHTRAYAWTHTHMHTLTHTHTHINRRTHKHPPTHTHTPAFTHTHTHTHTHTYTHTQTHTHTHTYTRTHAHTHACACTHIPCTLVHSHTHTYMLTVLKWSALLHNSLCALMRGAGGPVFPHCFWLGLSGTFMDPEGAGLESLPLTLEPSKFSPCVLSARDM